MSNRASGRSFSEFDKMSTKELEAILRLDSQLPEGADCDTELILYGCLKFPPVACRNNYAVVSSNQTESTDGEFPGNNNDYHP